MSATQATLDIVHGPRREPPALSGAYHGILARGLEGVGIEPAAWPRLAPELDRLLASSERPTPPLADLYEAAVAEGVLPYRASANVAAHVVRELVADNDRLRALANEAEVPEPGRAPASRIELWSVREGQTSSVWRVEIHGRGWVAPIVFALDIARGSGAAAAELKSVRAELERMHARDPHRINRVLALHEIDAVPVVVSTWLEGALELHVADDAHWIAVESFEPLPSGEQSPRGSRKDELESDACWAEFVDLTVTHSELGASGVQAAAFQPNDGDLVEFEGSMRAVATSMPTDPRPLGEWAARCLLPSAQCAAGTVVWPDMERALDAFVTAAERNPRLPAAVDCIDAAVEFTSRAGAPAAR